MRRTLVQPVLLGVVIAVLVAVVAALLLVPNATQIFQRKSVVTDQAKINKLVLGYVGAPYPDDYNVLRVPGWVDNLTTQRIVSATLEIQLLDKDGNRKELVQYEVDDIAARSRKSFNANGATFTQPRTATIKITRLEVAE